MIYSVLHKPQNSYNDRWIRNTLAETNKKKRRSISFWKRQMREHKADFSLPHSVSNYLSHVGGRFVKAEHILGDFVKNTTYQTMT